MQYSILGDDSLMGFLHAVQERKDAEILNSPRITLSNTQRGNIAVVKTMNYVQSTSVKDGVVTPVIGTASGKHLLQRICLMMTGISRRDNSPV